MATTGVMLLYVQSGVRAVSYRHMKDGQEGVSEPTITICTYATATVVDEITPASFRVPFDKPAEA